MRCSASASALPGWSTATPALSAGRSTWAGSDVPLAAEVARRLDHALPVFADNDANANALGEGFFGSARGCRHYVLFTIGSGLGSGLVRDGRIVNGTLGMVSNLGHYALDPEHGLPCPCGRRGCAETIVSGPSLVAATRAMLAAGDDSQR